MEELAAGFVGALVGVSAEVIALGLEQVGRQASGAVGIVVAKRRGKRRDADAALDGEADNFAPVGLGLLNRLVEVLVEEEIRELRVARVSLGDFLQEGGADDATTAEDLGNLAEIQLPAVFALRGAHELEALSVGANF